MAHRYGVVKAQRYCKWILLLVNLSTWNGAGEVLFEDDSWLDAKLSYEWACRRMAAGHDVGKEDFE